MDCGGLVDALNLRRLGGQKITGMSRKLMTLPITNATITYPKSSVYVSRALTSG